jgi:hypothetical protein
MDMASRKTYSEYILFPHQLKMLRLLIRFAGLLFLAGGFVALIVDGTRSLAGGGFYVETLANALAAIKPLAYQSLRQAEEAHFTGAILGVLLRTPLSLTLCAIGALLILLSHKHREAIGYLPE